MINRLNDLRKKMTNKRKKGLMNGLEVLENYRAFFPVTNEPSNIPFTTMYQSLLALACGITDQPVSISVC